MWTAADLVLNLGLCSVIGFFKIPLLTSLEGYLVWVQLVMLTRDLFKVETYRVLSLLWRVSFFSGLMGGASRS